MGRLILGDPSHQISRGDPLWRVKYETYMSGSAWQRTRQRFIAANGPLLCRGCGSSHQIALHHRTYDRLGSERLEDLVAVCPMCHKGIHELHRARMCSLEEATALVVDQKGPMNQPTPPPAPPSFIPANQRGAKRLPDGRLVSSLDWRTESRTLRGLTNDWHLDD